MTDTDNNQMPQDNPGDTRDGVFLFKTSLPFEVRAVVQSAFLEWEWLIPGWCQQIVIGWDGSGNDDTSLQINVQYEYRWAYVTVYPVWFDGSASARREQVLHEIIHLFTCLPSDYANETIGTLIEEDAPKFHATVTSELRRRTESATQDLAFLIGRKIAPV